MFADELQRQKALFAAVDGVALASAFGGALALHDPSGAFQSRLLEANPVLLVFSVPAFFGLWILVFHAFDLYYIRTGGKAELLAVAKACAISTLLTVFAAYLAHMQPSRLTVTLAFLLSIPAVLGGRILIRGCFRRLYAHPRIAVPLVVVGFNPMAHYLFDQILDGMTQYEPVGFVDDGAPNRQYRGHPVLGGPERLGDLAAMYPYLEAAIALPDAARERQEEIIAICEQHRIGWSIVPWLYRSIAAGLKVDMVGSLALIRPRGSNVQGLNFAVKRAFDLLGAVLLLIVTAPVIALGALAVWLFDGCPMFIKQTRIGIHGQPFQLLKLRTMRVSSSDAVHREYAKEWITNGNAAARENENGRGPVFKLINDDRVTAVGRLLRRFSMDELPQLINVVRGEMSLIGPRPALPYELELYQTWHRRRLEAVPGITGLWQVNGRNRVSFDDMVRLDVQYLEEWSLANDLRILARTLPILLRGDGV